MSRHFIKKRQSERSELVSGIYSTFRTNCTVIFHNLLICDLSRFWLYCFGRLVLLLPKLWIIWLSHLSILSVPDEVYSRNASCTLNLKSTFLLINYKIHNFFYADNYILFKFPMAPLRDVSIWFSSPFPIKFSNKQILL
jgi:hypothetical protein